MSLAVSSRLEPASAGWVAPGALLDLDFAAGRFYFGGRHFADEAALLAACGGLRTDSVVTIGPYDIPGAPERVSNGDFADGLTGWSTFGGGLISIDEAGHCRIDGNNGNVPGFVQPLALEKGHAYRVGVWVSDGFPGPGDHSVGIGTHPTLFGAVGLSITGQADGGHTIGENRTSTFSAAADTMYLGGRDISNPATGTTWYDDFSVTEVLPCAGFRQGGFSAIVAGTTPAAAGAGKVVFQADDGGVDWPYPTQTEYNRVRLWWDASQHLRLVVTETDQNGIAEQANLDLGDVPPETAFEVIFSAETDGFRAARRGGPVVSTGVGELPGIAQLRIGRGASGGLWDGEIGRVSLLPGRLRQDELLRLAADRRSIVAWGDSLTAGAGCSGNSNYPAVAEALFDPPRSVVNMGIGGQTATQIAARQGGVRLLLSVTDDTIPASGAVAVTERSVDVLVDSGVPSGSIDGWLGGLFGTLSTDESGEWSFEREMPGAPVVCPPGSRFTPSFATALRERTAWLWLGRNGAGPGHDVVGDVAAAVGALGHGRYLVGAILPSASDDAEKLDAISATNAALAGAHGDWFVDLLGILSAAHDGSGDDLADVAAGLVPRSLRSDAVHLNDAGYALVATAMRDATLAMGW
jgi:lysophospholipase L1-like esterase